MPLIPGFCEYNMMFLSFNLVQLVGFIISTNGHFKRKLTAKSEYVMLCLSVGGIV
jgi:hypothetical protein